MFSRDYKVVLDEDFQQIFKPFYYLQYLYCMQAFNISKNYAYAITKRNFILAAIVNMIIIILYYEMLQNFTFWDKTSTAIIYLTYCQYVQSFMLITFLNFYQNKLNFQLLVTLQELCGRIRNTEDTKRLKMMSWVCCSAVMIYYVSLVTLKLTRGFYWHWTRALFLLTTVVFEVKLGNLTVILFFLVLKLRKWRKILQNHFKDGVNKEILNDMQSIYKNIISVFCLYKKTFQSIVLFHFVMTFFQSLVYIEIIIISYKTAPADLAVIADHVMGVISWIIKGVVLELCFCVVCELFYSELESNRIEIVQKIGIELCKTEKSKEFIQFGKCVLRITENDFARMSACGVFIVDVALPLRLSSLVAAYTLVLLQFAQ